MRRPLLFTAVTCIAAISTITTSVQAATTDPVGYVNWDIEAGTGSTRNISVIALPLQGAADIDGAAVGLITGITSNTITASNAGWTAGELSNATAPYLIQVTKGAAEGRVFLISSSTPNTSTTITIDATDSSHTDLTSLGISTTPESEDTYKIIPCDTLSSIFGTPAETGVQGGAGSSVNADIVFVNIAGSWNKFFYDTNDLRWEKITLGSPFAGDTPIRLDYGILYSRIANTPINLTVTGSVPMTDRKFVMRNSGVTFVSNGYPVDRTLASLGLESSANWTSSAAAADSDIVLLFVNGGWKRFWHDGANWRQQTLGSPIKDDEIIAANTAILIDQRGVDTGTSVVSQTKPY